MFGGVVGDNPFNFSNDSFCCNGPSNKWTELQPKDKKNMPSPRAAHAAAKENIGQMVVFGGAHLAGELVANELYLLKVVPDGSASKGVKVPVACAKPTARYGHTMGFCKPYILMIGDNSG